MNIGFRMAAGAACGAFVGAAASCAAGVFGGGPQVAGMLATAFVPGGAVICTAVGAILGRNKPQAPTP